MPQQAATNKRAQPQANKPTAKDTIHGSKAQDSPENKETPVVAVDFPVQKQSHTVSEPQEFISSDSQTRVKHDYISFVQLRNSNGNPAKEISPKSGFPLMLSYTAHTRPGKRPRNPKRAKKFSDYFFLLGLSMTSALFRSKGVFTLKKVRNSGSNS